MGGPVATIVSFRLGEADGVSVEAAKWAGALRALGFEVGTVAGAGEAQVILPGLAMYAEEPPPAREIRRALEASDLVVVENLCSLPLNRAGADLVASALRGRKAILHHHDLPWQRERYRGSPAPPDDPAWAHVTINQTSRRQLARRGIDSVVMRNTFDLDAPKGDRTKGREALGVGEDTRLVLQPTRAIARKNVAGAIALAEALDATLWLPGPAEDGYGPELERLVDGARCEVVLGKAPGPDEKQMADAYAASDLVVLASTWEGFGNPALESAVHERPLAIGRYPVAAELAAFGFRWFAYDDVRAVAGWLERPDPRVLEHNHEVARRYFSSTELPGRLGALMERAGWSFF